MDPEADDLPMGVDVELCGFIDSRLLVEENASVKTLEAGDFIPGTHTEMTAKSFCVRSTILMLTGTVWLTDF